MPSFSQPAHSSVAARILAGSLTLLAGGACSSTSTTEPAVPPFQADAGSLDAGSPDSALHLDAPTVTTPDAPMGSAPEAGVADTGHDAPTVAVPDAGAADAFTRNAGCTPTKQETGRAVDTSHGRLDGTLVYVVGVGQGKMCNGDDSHVHLQVEVSGSVYDVAVDIGTAPDDEVGSYETTMAVPSGAWAEGWHGADALAYPSLGLSSSSFTTMAPGDMAASVETLLANTSKISIFCTGYSQGNGCHDVHYEDGSGRDGAIVLDPTAATSPILFFRFTSQSF